jgi:DNA-binding transcriptional LysR family regulator
VNLHNLPNLTVQQLEYLVAAADGATHAEAAASLGVSPSALSQGLTELSRRVGLVIFERNGRNQKVRPQAEPVIEHARHVLASIADLARYVERTKSGTAGLVRVGMIDAAAIDHFGEPLRRIRSERPDIDLHLTVGPSAGLFAALEQGRLDVVVGVEPDSPIPSVSWTELMTEELRIYAPPGQSSSDPARWGPWVTFPDGSHTRKLIEAALRRAGATFEVVAESHQPEVLREMVSLGLGWTVLPAVQAERTPGELRPASTSPVAHRVLVVAWRDSAVTPEAAVSLRDAFIAGSRDASRPTSPE